MLNKKFRIYDKDNDEMLYAEWGKINYTDINCNREYYPLEFGIGFKNYNVQSLSEPMQFIGLYDKKEIGIYDGDILSINGKITKLVRIDYDCLCVQIANIDSLKHQDSLDVWESPSKIWWNDFNREIEIIGNKFQNPEFLKTK